MFGPTLPVARERVAHVDVALPYHVALPYRVAGQAGRESVPMSRAQPAHPDSPARTNSPFHAKLQKISKASLSPQLKRMS